MTETVLAIGLMSGTSLDGIDAALIETDGLGFVAARGFATVDYTAGQRAIINAAVRAALVADRPEPDPIVEAASRLVTESHARLIATLLAQTGTPPGDVAVIGFHGQTIAHRPDRGWTWQIGDGGELGRMTGIPVVDQFRIADVEAGGQGAPLLPVYHRALLHGEPKPVAVLNLGGVGNLTWIGEDDALVAFDTGPGNGLVDQWVERATGAPFDRDGGLAASGEVHASVLDAMLDLPWFDLPPPKSLDRHDFTDQAAIGLSHADGAATLTRFTAETVALALRLCPAYPRRLLVAGGGRRNPTLMAMIRDATRLPVDAIDALGWNGDATEAEGFAYMAVRSLAGLPISFPGTTGVAEPMPGGQLHRPEGADLR